MLVNRSFDPADPLRQTSPFDWHQFEPQAPVSLFVDLLKALGIFKANAPRFGRRDEAEVANEEDPVLVDRFCLDTLQFTRKKP